MNDEMNIIFETICDHCNQQPIEVKSKRRMRELVMCRAYIVAMARKHTNLSLNGIGRYLDKDHATIWHATNLLDSLLKIYPSEREKYAKVEEQVLTNLKLPRLDSRAKSYETVPQL